MKICMISGTFPDLRCGVGDYTHWLCSELKKYNNIELTIITSQDPRVKYIEDIDVKPLINKWSFSKLALLLETLKKEQPDLVHLQYPTQEYKNKLMINFFPIFFKLIFRQTPLIVTIHDAKTAHLLNKLRLFSFLFFAQKIILTDFGERKYLCKKFPFLKSKLEVIHISSSIKQYEFTQEERKEMRLKLGVKEDEILISHFGYILSKKKLEIIFYALRRLLDEGCKAKLLFISSFEPKHNRYHYRLQRLVNQLNLNQYVIWSGYQVQKLVSQYLFSSDIGVQIYQDGLSLRRSSFIATLEHGLPIITTRGNDLPQGFKDHYNIIAVSAGDVKGLVDAIKELIVSKELRERIGKNTKLLLQDFSWEEIGRQHLGLYGLRL